MRLKLILLTSLIAAMIGASTSIGIIVGTLGSWNYAFASLGYRSDSWIALALYLPPMCAAIFAGIFVYRHTATRRQLQGGLTALLVLLFCLITFILLTLR
jgi:hypothetical protein